MSQDSYVALRRLQNHYGDVVTRRAWSELADVFRPDCALHLDLGDRSATHVGPLKIGEFIASAIAHFSFFQFVILNTVVELDEGAGRAAARMYIHELRVEAEGGRRTDAYGVYHDLFERDETGRWWFSHRHYNSFSRTAPADASVDQLVFPLPEIDLREFLAEG